jgi:uncharacterized protein
MPRPVKYRKVCCLPDNNLFGPLDGGNNENNQIRLSIEEYETIRLIDFEGLTQEECAERMQIARTTVQKIYNDARKKIADSIVTSSTLIIEGGKYILYNEIERGNCCCKCRRNNNCRYNNKEYNLEDSICSKTKYFGGKDDKNSHSK